MLKTRGHATEGPTAKLAPMTFERREPGQHDVRIQIAYCGICHSDIRQARDETIKGDVRNRFLIDRSTL